MPEPTTESPFRDVHEGRPWQYVTHEQGSEPELPERSPRITLLGLGMLLYALALAPAALGALFPFLFLTMISLMGPAYRTELPLGLAGLAGLLLPVLLCLVSTVGLFRLAPWSRQWTLITLPIALVLGAGEWACFLWVQLARATRGDVSFFDPRVLSPLVWYAVAMVPYTALLLFAATRPQVAKELAEARAAE